MKKYLLLAFVPLYVYGASSEEQAYKPSILHLENEYPIEINAKNEKQLTRNSQNIEKMFAYKRFPWEYVFGILIFGVLYLIVRQQPEIVVDAAEIQRKQREISRNKALDSLHDLNSKNLPESKEYDAFYKEITGIVRKYIEETYSLNAPTQTTEEFLQNISSHPVFDKDTELALGEFLQSADAVKFSEHTPTPEDCAKAQKTAENFILKK